MQMKSTEFLQAAIDVQKERGEQYDKPNGERSMAATVSAFNCITGYTLEESDGWMFMALLKLVRQAQNPEKYHHDSALDLVAYSSLYAEAASEQRKQLNDSSDAVINTITLSHPAFDKDISFNADTGESIDLPALEISYPDDAPSWDSAPEWAEWVAQDGPESCLWVWYEEQPVLKNDGWVQQPRSNWQSDKAGLERKNFSLYVFMRPGA
jgi:hypothetical protein